MGEFYIILLAVLGVISYLLWIIWRKTGAFGFLVGVVSLYLWSIHGALRMVRRYDYEGTLESSLFERLFFVEIDSTYLSVILLYALFIVTIEIVVLTLVKPCVCSIPEDNESCVRIKAVALFLISCFALFVSLYATRGARQFAEQVGISTYFVFGKCNYEGKSLYTLHLMMVYVALFSNVLALAVTFCRKRAKYLVIDNERVSFLLNGSMLFVLCAYVMSLGDRSVLISTFLMGILVYMGNSFKAKVRTMLSVLFPTIILVNVLQTIRGIPFRYLFSSVTLEHLYLSFMNMLNSSEFFAAHFSLYGALKYKIPLTWGSSLPNFLVSMVLPRALFPNRGEGIYSYYASYVGAFRGQGYTIHHATGWYLNFGVIGILVGAILFGWIWSKLYNYSQAPQNGKVSVLDLYKRFSFCFLTAYIPLFIRSGIEGYKAVIIGCFVVPYLVLFASAFSIKIKL